MMLKMSVMSIVCCSIFVLICIIVYVSNYINILCCISSVEPDSQSIQANFCFMSNLIFFCIIKNRLNNEE